MSDYSSNAAAPRTVAAVAGARRAYRRKQTVRSILISLASTIVVAGVLIAVVVHSDGWEATRNTFFNGKYFIEAFPQVLAGLWLNIRILLISVLGAVDAIRSAQMVQAKTYNMTSYVVAGLLFIILSFPFIRLSDWYTARLRKREQMGGTV